MCVIAIKPKGTDFPEDGLFTALWERNPDGAGFMYADHGKVCIRKGFMRLPEFLEAAGELKESLTDPAGTPAVFHFRIATHGGTKPGNCHPFAISDSVAVLQNPLVNTDVGVAHNGTIYVTPRPDISDTMEYILTGLSCIKKRNPRFFEDERELRRIGYAIGSRMAFLAADGTIATVGDFTEEDGMLFSNTLFRHARRRTSGSGTYSYEDEEYGRLGLWD